MKKPCEIVGQSIANLTPVAFGMNIYSLYQSDFQNDMWGPVNNVDHGNNVLNALNYGLYFIPGCENYGNALDCTGFAINLANGTYKY